MGQPLSSARLRNIRSHCARAFRRTAKNCLNFVQAPELSASRDFHLVKIHEGVELVFKRLGAISESSGDDYRVVVELTEIRQNVTALRLNKDDPRLPPTSSMNEIDGGTTATGRKSLGIHFIKLQDVGIDFFKDHSTDTLRLHFPGANDQTAGAYFKIYAMLQIVGSAEKARTFNETNLRQLAVEAVDMNGSLTGMFLEGKSANFVQLDPSLPRATILRDHSECLMDITHFPSDQIDKSVWKLQLTNATDQVLSLAPPSTANAEGRFFEFLASSADQDATFAVQQLEWPYREEDL